MRTAIYVTIALAVSVFIVTVVGVRLREQREYSRLVGDVEHALGWCAQYVTNVSTYEEFCLAISNRWGAESLSVDARGLVPIPDWLPRGRSFAYVTTMPAALDRSEVPFLWHTDGERDGVVAVLYWDGEIHSPPATSKFRALTRADVEEQVADCGKRNGSDGLTVVDFSTTGPATATH